jgi:hypothetical protein
MQGKAGCRSTLAFWARQSISIGRKVKKPFKIQLLNDEMIIGNSAEVVNKKMDGSQKVF